ncbi:carbonic anhydrase-like [Belonocnema kinseyi]|uniref:carbonic anhydrase-like n=1 Tax=Belonocnema kinseyi TaxID=2817044 RepID=UPI00143D9B34|nr:carbonic anhydrase-like [Belonocnema kinseyi]
MQNLKMTERLMAATILLNLILGASTYSYNDVQNWGDTFSKCKGRNQSPIIFNGRIGPGSPDDKNNMKFMDITKFPTRMTIKNTGHTVVIRPEWSGKAPELAGGPLNGTYVFEKITFHWTKEQDKMGSEHMNYEFTKPAWADMEMHMIFYRKDLNTFHKAESADEGLTIISFMLVTGNKYEGTMLKELEESLDKVQSINSTSEIRSFASSSLFTLPPNPFIFYKGSLDYPPCSESVAWLLCQVHIPISKALLTSFRNIKFSNGDVSNVRPLQAQEDRQAKFEYINYDFSAIMKDVKLFQ